MKTCTICCKLLSRPITPLAVQYSWQSFAAASNYILKIVLEEKIFGTSPLHKRCRRKIKTLFHLSPNLSVRGLRRVASCLTKLKREHATLATLIDRAGV